jgi:hypothetical protein
MLFEYAIRAGAIRLFIETEFGEAGNSLYPGRA